MKKLIFIFMLFYCTSLFFTSDLGTLPGINYPHTLMVQGDKVYVLEECTIYVFSLKDLTLLSRFGQEGEGPGELKKSSFYTNSFYILDDEVFVDSIDKILYFSKEGKFLRERKKKGVLVTRMVPIRDHFVVMDLDRKNGKKEYITISVLNSDMNKIREIYRQKSPVQIDSTFMVPDAPHFCVWQDKIFVEDSIRGFVIHVFDSFGKKLYEINRPFMKVEVTKRDKEDIFSIYKSEPVVKQIGFENLKKRVNFIFPKFYPAVQDIRIFNSRICVKTFGKKAGKEEYILMDSLGKRFYKIYMPKVKKANFLALLNGVELPLYSIDQNKFYFLEENEDEDWELKFISIR